MPEEGSYIIKSAAVQVVTRELYKAGISANQIGALPKDKQLYLSSLGTPVFADITVDPFNYTVDGVTYNVPGLKTYKCIIRVTKAKNIIQTPVQGLKGAVKEYITDGDDLIYIEGTLTSQNGIFPYNDLQDLNKLIDAPVSFKITNKWLQTLGIDTIVINGAEINQERGGQAYQNFQLYCSSDIPVELNLISSSNTTSG